MERVLRTVRMEALVNDLSHALEETSCSSANRRRWGLCRRARSTGNLRKAKHSLAFHTTQSDDSDSISEALLNRDRGHSSLHQSDSDDVSPARLIAPFNLQSRQVLPHVHALESDSVNENFSPVRPCTRRRRKLKRMAVDVSDEVAIPTSTSHLREEAHAAPISPALPGPLLTSHSSSLPSSSAILKKKRILRHSANCENSVFCGKRKRSLRDRSGGDCDVPMLEDGLVSRSHKTKSGSRTRDRAHVSIGDDCMDVSGSEFASSSPSLSSNESDAGFFTTDEGREGDDEHSDWYGGEGRGWWEDDDDEGPSPHGSKQDGLQQGAAFQAFLHMSADARKSLREGMRGREIRAGRRRLQGNRAAFSVLTSANEKLSRFLQDSSQSELRLHPMQHEEKDQLVQLANLYSLQMRLEPTVCSGLTCPVLTKTRDTVRVEQVTALSRRLNSDSGLKRRKLPSSAGILQQGEANPAGSTSDNITRSIGLPPPVHSPYNTHSTGCHSN